MVVFGIPVAHEDDALRAVRAVAEPRDRLTGLGEELSVALCFRTGVNTGKVVAGEGETLVTAVPLGGAGSVIVTGLPSCVARIEVRDGGTTRFTATTVDDDVAYAVTGPVDNPDTATLVARSLRDSVLFRLDRPTDDAGGRVPGIAC